MPLGWRVATATAECCGRGTGGSRAAGTKTDKPVSSKEAKADKHGINEDTWLKGQGLWVHALSSELGFGASFRLDQAIGIRNTPGPARTFGMVALQPSAYTRSVGVF